VRGRPLRLLILGLVSPGSGLTHVIEQLFGKADGFAIDLVGFVPPGGATAASAPVAPFNLHLHPYRGFGFGLSPAVLNDYMTRLAPEMTLVMGPVFLVSGLLRMLQRYRTATHLVLYLPIEGQLADPAALATVANADTCILYTEFARRNVQTLWSDAGEQKPPRILPRLSVVGHGVDSDVFTPFGGGVDGEPAAAGRAAARRRLFAGDPELDRAFIVLNANRAYYRKRLDLTIAGFAKFAAEKPDAFLYLHVPALTADDRKALDQAIRSAQIGERVLLNRLNPDAGVLPLDTLNLLYNACDVGVTTAMGEGWGLGTFEHAATGAPQIVPDHTSFAENWRGAAVMLPIVSRQFIFYEFADMFEVAPADLAGALDRLYVDTNYRGQMAQAAYRRATEPRFRWAALSRQMAALLTDVAGNHRPLPADNAEMAADV
jgi:D-inositol-3-phosphate glycosyltransferase